MSHRASIGRQLSVISLQCYVVQMPRVGNASLLVEHMAIYWYRPCGKTDSVGTSKTSDGDSIRVFVRVRPLVADTSDVDRGLCMEVSGTRIVMRAKPDDKVFTFDDVADQSSTQESIFCSVGKKIIDGCVGGYNGTIFAYGQTGSGKTFTMLGPHEESGCFQHELRGVIPRSFDYLFKLLKKEQEVNGTKMEFMCKCTFLEIYNELVHDLLDPASPSLQVRENIKRGIFVENLREVAVTSAADAYAVLNRGWSNRKVAETTMNHESSRSHAVFTVNIETKVNKGGVWAIKSSQLHLVDLAGSERQKDTNASGVRLKEAGSINKSLSTLGNVIMSLVDISRGKNRHIPYRDSKLTFLLKDSLGGNSRTCIIACVHPGSKCFGETISTLQFAKRAKLIKNKAIVNEDMQGSVIHLQAEIKRLKELLMQSQASASLQPALSVNQSSSTDGVSDGQLDRYQAYFVQAMLLWQQLNNEKQLLTDKYRCAEETCSRKDKALSQFKMILKFREEALRRVEKSVKSKSSIDSDDKDIFIESLRSEIRSFELIVNNHPEVTRCKMENESLKCENQRLRACLANSTESINLAELEKVFLDVSEMKVIGNNVESVQVASSPVGQSMASAAAIDRYRLQIEELEKQLTEVKTESGRELQRLQRQHIEAEAEIAGLVRAKDEMEKILKAHQVRTKIERDIHNDTIKVMTTPKKSGSTPRNSNRDSLPSMKVLEGQSPDLVSSTLSPVRSGDSESITAQTPPDQVNEQQIEGLQDEISRLQEQIYTMEMDFKTKEQNIVQLLQEKSRLQTENQLLDQMAERNRISWLNSQTELQQRLGKLEKLHVELTNANNMLSGECQDLRIMNAAGDKKSSELRGEMQLLKTSMEKEISKLETDVLKLTVDRNELKDSFDSVSEQYEQLKEQEENTQATLDFTADRLREVEDQFAIVTKELAALNAEFKTSEKTVENVKREKEMLLTQLKQETGAKESQLVETLQQLETVREELRLTVIERDAIDSDLRKNERLVHDARTDCENLRKAEAKREEAISSLKVSIEELREVVAQRDSTIATQREDISSLEAHIGALNQEIESLRHSGEEQVKRQAALISVRNAELEMLREDNESLTMRIESFAQQVDDESLQKARLLSDNEKLEDTVNQLQAKIFELRSSLEEARRAQEQQPEMLSRCTVVENQLSELREAFDVVSMQYEEAVVDANKAKSGLSSLQSQLWRLQSETLEVRQQNLELKLDNSILKSRITDCEVELETHQELKLTAQKDAFDATEKLLAVEASQSHLQAELSELRDRLTVMTESVSENEKEKARLGGIIENSFETLDLINSRCATLEEENRKLAEQNAKLQDDLMLEISENAKLSSHKNHAQKINYVERLKEQLLNADKRIKELELQAQNDRLKQFQNGIKTTPQRLT